MRQFRSDDTSKWKEGLGKAKDGSTYSAPANAGCSGTATQYTLTLDNASSFANGDLILIHQTRGSNSNSTSAGVVNWELNKIVSGGGTTTLTLKYPLDITYVDSGDSQAQVIEMKEYKNLTLSGTITPSGWDGNKGGIGGFFNMGTLSGSSAILNLNGNAGTVGNGTQNPTNGGGFRGGRGTMNGTAGSATSYRGEGTAAASAVSTSANGNGGGAGTIDDHQGGSGGHAATGANGTGGGTGGGANGTGGAIRGVAELTRAVFGGGGGGGQEMSASTTNGCSSGGNGGGIWFIFSQNIDLSGITVRTNGGSSPNTADTKGAGAGGAGGSILYKCVNGTFGTNKTTATGGATGTPLTGNGSVGRIHVDYSGSISGTTNPSLSSRNDLTIKPISSGGGAFLLNMI